VTQLAHNWSERTEKGGERMAIAQLVDKLSAEIADVLARVLPEMADPVLLQDADTDLTLESMAIGPAASGCNPCYYCTFCAGCPTFAQT